MLMPASAESVTHAVAEEACQLFDQCLVKIRHCVAQLSDEQVWWRPREAMNSIGNLILHLTGNVRQWIVAGIGGEADVRKRPAEFQERGPIPAADLIQRLEEVVRGAQEVLRQATAEQ